MYRIATATAALLASTAIAHAGGVERSAQSMAILFEEGTYAQLSYSFVDADVSGVWSIAPVSSGDVAPSFNTMALSYRQDMSDRLSFALIIDEHIGADVGYAPATGYPVAGSNATIDGLAMTALLRYEVSERFSVFGGLRVSQAEGEVALPFLGPGYTMSADGGTEVGYVAGVAYEIPDIALRVALSYNSEIEHTFSATETLGPTTSTTFNTTIPQSWNLEFQSGIAPDTLLFGSIRWVDWSVFDITPTVYTLATAGGSLVNYTDDTVTYTLGVGRRFNENWSGAISAVHEPANGGQSGNLGPTDGRSALGIGVTWENEQFEVSGGVQYSRLGDTFTVPAVGIGNFTDNSSIAVGLRLGIRF